MHAASAAPPLVEALSPSDKSSHSLVPAPLSLQPPIPPTILDPPEYILYLEASPQSRLYQSILSFYERSSMEFGRNEAHMYHPHTSVTGFFRIDPRSLTVAELLQFLDTHVARQQPFLANALPNVGPILLRANPHRLAVQIQPGSELLLLVKAFRDFVETRISAAHRDSAASMPAVPVDEQCHVRVKNLDHISLAYRRLPVVKSPLPARLSAQHQLQAAVPSGAQSLTASMDFLPTTAVDLSSTLGNATPASPRLARSLLRRSDSSQSVHSTQPKVTTSRNTSATTTTTTTNNNNTTTEEPPLSLREGILSQESLEQLGKLAQEMVDLETPVSDWHLVFYQLTYKSDTVLRSHRFQELRRYSLRGGPVGVDM